MKPARQLQHLVLVKSVLNEPAQVNLLVACYPALPDALAMSSALAGKLNQPELSGAYAGHVHRPGVR